MDYNSGWKDHLNAAAREGDLRTIQSISEYACMAVVGSYALQVAARHNHFSVVEHLLQFSSPEQNTNALLEAIDFGRVDIVRLLLPKSRPKANKSEALRVAVASENQTIIDLLFPKSNPEAALQQIFKEDGLSDQYYRLEHLIQQRAAVKMKRKLHQEVAKTGASRVRKL